MKRRLVVLQVTLMGIDMVDFAIKSLCGCVYSVCCQSCPGDGWS